MAKSKPAVTTEFTTSKTGKLRDPRATTKLALGLAFAKSARKAAQRKANLLIQVDRVIAVS